MRVGEPCPACGTAMVAAGTTFENSYPVVEVRCPNASQHILPTPIPYESTRKSPAVKEAVPSDKVEEDQLASPGGVTYTGKKPAASVKPEKTEDKEVADYSGYSDEPAPKDER